jgi:hypothetical protein
MYAWLAGDISTVGDLYMLGRTLHRWTGLPTSRCEDPDFSISTTSFDFVGGDGSDVVLVDENSDGDDEMLFVSSMNGNRVLGTSLLLVGKVEYPNTLFPFMDETNSISSSPSLFSSTNTTSEPSPPTKSKLVVLIEKSGSSHLLVGRPVHRWRVRPNM